MYNKLTKQQFSGLSWLAYYQVRHISGACPFSDVACAANYCENVLSIPYSYIYRITVEGNIKRLQNMNKLGSTEYYD